jgi:LmbE family N-acetylglucosaminyl deacetylase
MFGAKNILVLAPHTDDGELGCGASIARYAAAGKRIFYLAFSTCADSLPDSLPFDTLRKECTAATQLLGVQETKFLNYRVRHFPSFRQEILEELVKLNRIVQPDTVFLPAQHDVHQDHNVIYAEGLRAFKSANLLGYELPWNNRHFQPTFFQVLSEHDLDQKMNALKLYLSQAHRNYMQQDFIRSLATVRGVQAGTPLAEAFEVYRIVGK